MRRLWVLLPLLLTACQDSTARQQNADLARRVTALEAEVRTLKREQATAAPPADASEVTARAAAQNCATQLSRTLEDYRRSSLEGRYPRPQDLTLPPACQNQTVKWQQQTAAAYAFTVQGAEGAALAEGKGP